eukprot:scaffold27396_cov44-Attheya_sp.AAC.2
MAKAELKRVADSMLIPFTCDPIVLDLQQTHFETSTVIFDLVNQGMGSQSPVSDKSILLIGDVALEVHY